jgi:hypothetical protein
MNAICVIQKNSNELEGEESTNCFPSPPKNTIARTVEENI